MIDSVPITIPRRRMISPYRRELVKFARDITATFRPGDRLNAHYAEWRQQALNYWRCVEMPLCYYYLAQTKLAGGRLLDLGSPKLLSLYLAARNHSAEVIASDISDYFVQDLEEFREHNYLTNLGIEVLDARRLPYVDSTFDQVFSVSVIEHIPEDGDQHAMAEIARVLKAGGRAIITVPYKQEYLEEYQQDENLYWKDHSKTSEGRLFYQRRYNWHSLESRLIYPSGLCLREAVLVGEKPLNPGPNANSDGRLVENWNFIDSLPSTRLLKRIARRMKWTDQWVYTWYSQRCHYFTRNIRDSQALNVVLVLEKDKNAPGSKKDIRETD